MNRKRKMKFVIVSPKQLRPNGTSSGGPIVLHALCKYLTEAGYDACIFDPLNLYYTDDGETVSAWRRLRRRLKPVKYIYLVAKDQLQRFAAKLISIFTKGGGGKILRAFFDLPVEGCKHKLTPFIGKNTIVLYPESFHGNLLKAKNVVRWFLFFNRFPNDDTAYGKNDLFFSYSQKFNDPTLNPEGRICTLSYYNWDVYKRTNFGPRKGTCYILHKGFKRPDLPQHFDGILIDGMTEREKAKYFNSCEYCVSYDTYTAYSSIAAMLGCISIVVPEPGKTQYDYGGPRPGISFSFDSSDIQAAKSSLHILAEQFARLEQSNRENTRFFIEECHKHFNML